ncbi:MAG: hypothetical protein CO184_00935 [Candidatus Zambryskibacteria bacterium CG_4_9_14_3_um_filter_40_16]|uniref:D-alanine--D-alanine ligase n=2 Tax=Candidatus Zambryskiibacteriota TaxID=1817925 RepID=A0A2M7WUP4_9BACT|nr:MAG: hypothetical protein CO184_00935 [Candidatus Zambryskibacteria bacterium CG_4_9_14_3_um_filter_40_16]
MISGAIDKNKIRVGVLRGGPSSEYEISLLSGHNVLKNIPERYEPIDILISKDGVWYLGGVPKSPDKILQNVDVVLNALHGKFGEDGKVQNILEKFNISYTGSRPLPSAVSMNKIISKRLFSESDIKTPYYTVFHPKHNVRGKVRELFKSFPQPSIIKPFSGGSSVGITYASNFDTFENGIENALRHGGVAVIEEYIPGKEITVTVLESGDDASLYSLFPVEIVKPASKNYLDYETKCDLNSGMKCPSTLSKDEKIEAQDMAIRAHRSLGLRHYSNADFIVHPTRGIFLIEVNSLPGITENSILPKSLEVSGISLSDFIDHILKLSLKKN